MDELFKALPRDLQWEILSDFVGTHVVRNGKLMRKMTGNIQSELADKMRNDCDSRLYLKIKPSFKPAGKCFTYNNITFSNKFLLFRRDGMTIYLCMISKSDMSYMYNTLAGCFIIPIDGSVILPPFLKHEYPSYPFTNKKMGIANKKMTLYNPIPVAAYTWSEEDDEPEFRYYGGKFFY